MFIARAFQSFFIALFYVISVMLILLGFYVSIVLSIVGLVPFLLPVWWGIFNFMFSFLCGHKHMRVISELIAKVHTQVDGYLRVLKLVNKTEFKSAELQALKKKTCGCRRVFRTVRTYLTKDR